MIYAEQNGITSSNALEMPVVELFGADFKQMFGEAILAVGNYGEVFNRTLSSRYSYERVGRNRLYVDGPLFVALNFSLN